MAISFTQSTYRPELYAKLGDIRCEYVDYFIKRHGGKLKWRDNERVLEIGCGVGDVTRRCFFPLLPRNFQKFVLSDFSPKMIEFAKKEFQGVDHVDFMLLDIEKELESSLNGGFDKILSSLCFMHVGNQVKSFENVFKLLAPGGECFIVLMSTAAIFETIFRLAETPKWAERLKHHREVFILPYREDPNPEETIGRLLKNIGFVDVFVKKEEFFHLYPTVDDFRETLKCMRDVSSNLSQEEKEELLEDRVKLGIHFNVIKELHDPNRPILQKAFENLTIYAKKPENS
ncbi:juvenile hormone acid O-methyltransferase-like [Lutzomyia longipalpis]|uniref:juvenile hormone acid O-methyltransferase-like n=1 Tax=Lutzomyia longipalpis TaxID=7200 RepID=UPI002483A103|nr:juvenile hormone acid O-methyltransferase-like [Lutzomyia longipalpis]